MRNRILLLAAALTLGSAPLARAQQPTHPAKMAKPMKPAKPAKPAKAVKAVKPVEADKIEAEKIEAGIAHGQKHFLKGIKLTKSEKTQVKSIQHDYQHQYATLRSDAKSGNAKDPALAQKMTDLADRERAAIRAVLTPDQVTRFDANVSKVVTKH